MPLINLINQHRLYNPFSISSSSQGTTRHPKHRPPIMHGRNRATCVHNTIVPRPGAKSNERQNLVVGTTPIRSNRGDAREPTKQAPRPGPGFGRQRLKRIKWEEKRWGLPGLRRTQPSSAHANPVSELNHVRLMTRGNRTPISCQPSRTPKNSKFFKIFSVTSNL